MLAKYVNPDCEIEQRRVAKQRNDVKNDFTLVMSVYYERVYTETKGGAVLPSPVFPSQSIEETEE